MADSRESALWETRAGDQVAEAAGLEDDPLAALIAGDEEEAGSSGASAGARADLRGLDEGIDERDSDNFAQKQLKGRRLETISDAVSYCKELLDKQIERARERKPDHNKPVPGDAEARRAVQTLLPDQFIREVFLDFTRSPDAWPRLRPLFGAPPYGFLLPDDAGVVRAAGIASARVNMAYAVAGGTVSYSQFGVEHLVDSYGREYRLLPSEAPRPTHRLPCDLYETQGNRPVLMNVRVPKRSREEKQRLFANEKLRSAVLFPQVGEILEVQTSPTLLKVWGASAKSGSSKMRVHRIVSRGEKGSTAALVGVPV